MLITLNDYADQNKYVQNENIENQMYNLETKNITSNKI